MRHILKLSMLKSAEDANRCNDDMHSGGEIVATMSESDIRIQIEETASCLTMRITVPPRDTDGVERVIFWGSMLFLFIGVMVIVQGGSAVYGGLLFLAIGIIGGALSVYNRNHVWRGSDTLYRVSCGDGIVTFARGDYEQSFERDKLRNIWFTKRTRYGKPCGVDLNASYNDDEVFIFELIELNSVPDDAQAFLEMIDAYVNRECREE